MKFLKTYEQNTSTEPQIGDYVICDENSTGKYDNELVNFLHNNIGQIIGTRPITIIIVKYKNIPKKLKKHFYEHKPYEYKYTREFYITDPIYWSKNKEDLEIYLTANKYNL